MSKATYRDMTGPNGLLARRKEFDGNSMSARYVRSLPFTGRLDPAERQRLEFDFQTANDMNALFYVVYSYATPVAWAIIPLTEHAMSIWLPAYCVSQRFSVTTSKGQGYVRAWINHHAQTHDVASPCPCPTCQSGVGPCTDVNPGWRAYQAERKRIFGVKVGG